MPFERRMMPATCLLSSNRNDGANGASVTVPEAVPPAVATTTETVPVAVSSGACTLICDGLTYSIQAGLSSMVTLAPPSVVVNVPFQEVDVLAKIGSVDRDPLTRLNSVDRAKVGPDATGCENGR